MEIQLKKSGVDTQFTKNLDLSWATADISRFLKKNNIRNYILCEESNQNLKDRDLDFIHLKNLKFKNFFDQTKIKRFLSEIIDNKNINLVHISSRAPAFFLINF